MRIELLGALRNRANYHGLVNVREERLLGALKMTREEVVASLDALVQARLIDVISPLPFLVVKMLKWSGRGATRSIEAPDSAVSRSDAHNSVPVSSNAAAAAALSKQADGGAGEGEVLLDDVLAVLGPSASRREFRRILAGRDAGLIRRCLRRVQDTQAIRVSKAALFRSLLTKLS